MKRKVLVSLMLSMVLALGLAACGGEKVEPVEKESQVESVENESEEEVIQEESTEIREETQVTENVETEEKEEVTEKVEEDVWVPDEFVYNDVTSLDFVAPAVHNGDGEPCNFLWNYTEEDLIAWYLDKYGDEEGQLVEQVKNIKNGQAAGEKSYTISKNNYEEKESYSLDFKVGIYHESNVSQVGFTIKDKEQEVVIAEAKAFLEMMGFGEYAEDIIYSKNWGIDIATENDKGSYSVSSSYDTSEYSQNYSLRVSVSYSDYNFTNDFMGYDAVNLEYWEDYFALADYLEYSEFDTSSLDAFVASERSYTEALYGNAYNEGVSVNQEFSYSRYDLEKLDEVDFYYSAKCTDSNDKLNTILTIDFAQGERMTTFNISANGRPLFENRSENRYIAGADDVTLEERQELCELRQQLMKKLDSNIKWTKNDLLNSFNSFEFGEDSVKSHYYGDGYQYHIMNSLDSLSMYGKFEAKEEESVEE